MAHGSNNNNDYSYSLHVTHGRIHGLSTSVNEIQAEEPTKGISILRLYNHNKPIPDNYISMAAVQCSKCSIHHATHGQQSRTSESCNFCTPPRCDFWRAGPSTRKPSAKKLQKMVVV